MSNNLPTLKGLDHAFAQVREFHQAFGHPCPNAPTMQSAAKAQARAGWLDEEAQELREAETIQDQADAYLDILYFALGGFVELGLMPQDLFDHVHQANMGKLHFDENGKPYVKRDENNGGKIMKPERWQQDFAPEPRIIGEIERQSITRPLYEMDA